MNLFLLLYCIVNLISESASQGEVCCIIVRDQYSSWGSTAALNCFLTQKSVSRMTRGRSRKRYQTSRKSTDENGHSQTAQGEEIATPPAWHTSPRRGTEINSNGPLQTEESGIGNDSFYAASAVSPNSNHQVQRVPLFTVDRTAKPVPNAPESRELFLQCLTHIWHRDIRVFARQSEEYSNEAHLSAVKAAILYSETLLQSQDDKGPDYEPSDEEDRGCTGEFHATKSKKLFQGPCMQKKEKELNKQHHRHHALPPQIADFPSQSIERKSTRGSVLCDDFIAHSQLWQRSGTLAFTARATTLPKLVLNCVRAQIINPRTQFFAWNIIPTMGQSTSLSRACPNRAIWQPPTSPKAPISLPQSIYLSGAFPGCAFSSASRQQHNSWFLVKKNQFTTPPPPSTIPPSTPYPRPNYTHGKHAPWLDWWIGSSCWGKQVGPHQHKPQTQW